MQVGASGKMTQTSMRKMDGSGASKGNGMQDVMQALSPEDRTTFRDELSILSQTDRTKIKDQIKALDISSLSSEELSQTLADFLVALQENAPTQTIPTTSMTLDVVA